MNKAEKFVNKTFEENKKFYSITDAYFTAINAVCNKFKDKKIPPEYVKALKKIKHKNAVFG